MGKDISSQGPQSDRCADGALPVLTETQRLRTLVWLAWREMNAVRAATGSPRGYDGYSLGCSQDWWSDMVDAMGEELGDADRKPWSADYMKPFIDAIAGRRSPPPKLSPDDGASSASTPGNSGMNPIPPSPSNHREGV